MCLGFFYFELIDIAQTYKNKPIILITAIFATFILLSCLRLKTIKYR